MKSISVTDDEIANAAGTFRNTHTYPCRFMIEVFNARTYALDLDLFLVV